jgi:hypothetical protein
MRFKRFQDQADNRHSSLMYVGVSSELEQGGTYWIADSSIEDFLPAEQKDRRLAMGPGNGRELALPTNTQPLLKLA